MDPFLGGKWRTSSLWHFTWREGGTEMGWGRQEWHGSSEKRKERKVWERWLREEGSEEGGGVYRRAEEEKGKGTDEEMKISEKRW